MAEPLPPDRIEIRAVQFVGTNVEMTYLVDAPEAEAEARLEALMQAKLGLYALTATGAERSGDDRVLQRFSIIASPLDRLFHKIGPSVPLTTIKHASVTLELSAVNLVRQGHGLMRTNPGPELEEDAEGAVERDAERDAKRDAEADVETWTPWDVGKLLGALLREPSLLDHGEVRIADVSVERGVFPHAVLPVLADDVAVHGGVRTVIPPGLRAALAG